MSKKLKDRDVQLIPEEMIKQKIFLIRGKRVMLDFDLAQVYGVTTARLNQQVRRNLKKFPSDFLFQLDSKEFGHLMLQFATSKKGRGGRKKLPLAFTEHGALMAATVLNSSRAVSMSVYVIRAFVRLREVFLSNQILQERLSEIEQVLLDHDVALEDVYEKIGQLFVLSKKTKTIDYQFGNGDA